MKPVNVQPRAEAEAAEAAAWYESEQPGLGIEFLLELDAAIERAAEAPLAYAPVFMGARRVLMRRFPFAVYLLYELKTAGHRSLSANKQLQRIVIPNRWRAASAPFHYALAPHWTRGRAAAELRRYAAPYEIRGL